MFSPHKQKYPSYSKSLFAQRAVRIANVLYSSNTLSVIYMVIGFLRPIAATLFPISEELFHAQVTLSAKHIFAQFFS